MNTEVSLDVDFIEGLPAKTMLQLIEKAQATQKNLTRFRETVRLRTSLFRRLEELDIDLTFNAENEYIVMRFTGDGKRLGDVWGELRRAGYTVQSRPEKGETEFNAFWRQEGLAEILMLFSSSVCRRVKVGTRTVVQDVYETQCGELPVLEERIHRHALHR